MANFSGNINGIREFFIGGTFYEVNISDFTLEMLILLQRAEEKELAAIEQADMEGRRFLDLREEINAEIFGDTCSHPFSREHLNVHNWDDWESSDRKHEKFITQSHCWQSRVLALPA